MPYLLRLYAMCAHHRVSDRLQAVSDVQTKPMRGMDVALTSGSTAPTATRDLQKALKVCKRVHGGRWSLVFP